MSLVLISIFLETVTGCVCPITKTTNPSGFPWTKRDTEIVEQVKDRCQSIYKNSPCAKQVDKIEEHGYHVTCGALQCEI